MPFPGRRPFVDRQAMQRVVQWVVKDYMYTRCLYNMSPYHRSNRTSRQVFSIMCRSNPDRLDDHQCERAGCGDNALESLRSMAEGCEMRDGSIDKGLLRRLVAIALSQNE